MKDTDKRKRRIMEATAARLPEVLLDILETPPKRRRGVKLSIAAAIADLGRFRVAELACDYIAGREYWNKAATGPQFAAFLRELRYH